MKRVDKATMLIVDLSSCHPAVQLLLGYALGRGLKPVLLMREGSQAPTGLAQMVGGRSVVYKRIRDVEEALKKHLGAVKLT